MLNHIPQSLRPGRTLDESTATALRETAALYSQIREEAREEAASHAEARLIASLRGVHDGEHQYEDRWACHDGLSWVYWQGSWRSEDEQNWAGAAGEISLLINLELREPRVLGVRLNYPQAKELAHWACMHARGLSVIGDFFSFDWQGDHSVSRVGCDLKRNLLFILE